MLTLLVTGCPSRAGNTVMATSSPGTIEHCPVQGCGSNTPYLSGSVFVEALNLDGRPDRVGVKFLPQTFRCKNSSAQLSIRDGALVGRNGSALVCEGIDLIGATFDVEKVGVRKTRTTITIAAVGDVSTWEKPNRGVLLPTYHFTFPNPTNGEPTSFCPLMTASWMDPEQVSDLVKTGSGYANPAGVPGAEWHAATQHALIVQGETYGQAGNVDKERSGPRWFNIACAGAAFSKMRLLGFDPMQNLKRPGDREATLKMLTARYRGPKSYTEQGMPVAWVSARGTRYYGSPDPATVGPIEAMWDSSGAICQSHARVWRTATSYDNHIGLEKHCLVVRQPCSSLQGQISRSALKGVVWTTFTAQHVDHSNAQTSSVVTSCPVFNQPMITYSVGAP